MPLMIYNSLTRKKEEFVPLIPDRVHIYVCGPTVYGDAHIGHAKSYISFDVIVRYFRYIGYKVKYVQNITDVGHLTDDADEGEDKIEEQARKEKLDPMEVAEHYAWSYFDDMDALGVVRANIYPRASGHIIEQIEFIKSLIEKGFAYEVNGNVYFDVSKSKDYGKLSGRKIEELDSAVRIELKTDKKNPQDFALWKKADSNHLMQWPSPWGKGYPGWHIECSAMSVKYLGETFDIHGGGLENIFPHHECEIAQSEALTGKPFARYWMHNNMVTVDGVKMGKSLGNFITVKEALEKYKPETLRFFILSSHYRSQLDFSDSALSAAEKGLEKLLGTIRNLKKVLAKSDENISAEEPFDVEEFRKKFETEMNDDFNSPRAIAVLFNFSRELNTYLNSSVPLNWQFLQKADKFFDDLAGNLFGLIPQNLPGQTNSRNVDDIEKIIHLSIGLRTKLRQEKQFGLADEVRNKLSEMGIKLIDKPEGTEFELE